jgi:hypothetical protein
MMAQNQDWRIEAFDEATKIRLDYGDRMAALIVEAEPELKIAEEKDRAMERAAFKASRIEFVIQLREKPESIKWSSANPYEWCSPDFTKKATARLSALDTQFRDAYLEFARIRDTRTLEEMRAKDAARRRHAPELYRIEKNGFEALKKLHERVLAKWKVTQGKQ